MKAMSPIVCALGLAVACLPEPPAIIDAAAGTIGSSSGGAPSTSSGSSSDGTTSLADPTTTAVADTGTTSQTPADGSSGTSGANGFLRDYGPCVDVTSNQALSDFVVDGVAVECELQSGPYDGRLPPSMGWDPDTCEVTGRNTVAWDPEDPKVDPIPRIGIWAAVVEVTHPEGMSQRVPICVGRGLAELPYSVFAMNPDGTAINEPRALTFAPGGDVSLGAASDTRFVVTDEAGCTATPCPEQDLIIQSVSGGGAWSASIEDFNGEVGSFDARLAIAASSVADARPVVIQLDLLACLESSMDFCLNVPFHGRGPFSYTVIFHPELQ